MLLWSTFILLSPDCVRHSIWDDLRTFHCNDYFMVGGILTCLGVSSNPMFLWISSNSCPLNLLLVQSHQAEIIIVKCLMQGRNNGIRVQVEPRSCDQDRCQNNAFTLLTTLPTIGLKKITVIFSKQLPSGTDYAFALGLGASYVS